MEIFLEGKAATTHETSETGLTEVMSISGLAHLRRSICASDEPHESGDPFSDWLGSSASKLFVSEGEALACRTRDVCGKRLTILGSTLPAKRLLSSAPYKMAERAARRLQHDLIQWEIDRESFEKGLIDIPSGFYCTNLVFGVDFELAPPTTNQVIPTGFRVLNFDDPCFLRVAADLEYWVRWTFPGSTHAPLDRYDTLLSEYGALPELVRDGFSAGLTWGEAQSKAYVLWIGSPPLDTALIAMIWVDKGLRGELSGDELLRTAACHMKSIGFRGVRYLVSAQNISAMKMLHRSGFRLLAYTVNKSLS
jgi:ribosomal protein S18 acetylase RimI-like enzyme